MAPAKETVRRSTAKAAALWIGGLGAASSTGGVIYLAPEVASLRTDVKHMEEMRGATSITQNDVERAAQMARLSQMVETSLTNINKTIESQGKRLDILEAHDYTRLLERTPTQK